MMEDCSSKQGINNNNNNRRTQNKKPGSCNPKPVPSWEKDFCKVVGYFEWDTLLQMKKCMYFYDNVIRWNDSACQEALHNAKARYWADINGIHCHIPLPDPDLYIQNIDWSIKIVPGPLDDLDNLPVPPKSGHDPVVMFGDSFFADKGSSPTGWGDGEDNFKFPVDNYYGGSWGQNLNWGKPCDNNLVETGWTGCDDSNNNYYSYGQNLDWGISCNSNVAASGWPDFSTATTTNNNESNAWRYSNGVGAGYTLWGGVGWNYNNWGWGWGWGWGFGHNDHNICMGPYAGDVRVNAGQAYKNMRVQANGAGKNHMWRDNKGHHNKRSYNQGDRINGTD